MAVVKVGKWVSPQVASWVGQMVKPLVDVSVALMELC